ncbi:MAG: RsmE family RNA methyltransferase [Bacteroidota bacterium]
MISTVDYFYCPPEHISGDTFTIGDDEFKHLVHVMRKKAGDAIRIVDGKGCAYDAVLEDLKKKTASGRITAVYRDHNEPPLRITVAAGVLKNPSRFDFLVEKATELGVTKILPMTTRRVITGHAKTDRWQKLALAAMKQSCRSFLPEVTPLTRLNDIMKSDEKFDLKIIAHEHAGETGSIKHLQPGTAENILLLIGPEGGFTDEEVDSCIAAGYKPLYMGARRLRTETAAITALALLMNLS